jgi:hypothetical protein
MNPEVTLAMPLEDVYQHWMWTERLLEAADARRPKQSER